MPAFDYAGTSTRRAFGEENPRFGPDNRFGGHVHGQLRTLLGIADYPLNVKDAAMLGRVDALYRDMRSEGTRFGFLPEIISRSDDLPNCYCFSAER